MDTKSKDKLSSAFYFKHLINYKFTYDCGSRKCNRKKIKIFVKLIVILII